LLTQVFLFYAQGVSPWLSVLVLSASCSLADRVLRGFCRLPFVFAVYFGVFQCVRRAFSFPTLVGSLSCPPGSVAGLLLAFRSGSLCSPCNHVWRSARASCSAVTRRFPRSFPRVFIPGLSPFFCSLFCSFVAIGPSMPVSYRASLYCPSFPFAPSLIRSVSICLARPVWRFVLLLVCYIGLLLYRGSRHGLGFLLLLLLFSRLLLLTRTLWLPLKSCRDNRCFTPP